MKPLKDAKPYMGIERARALEGVVDDGEDVLKTLQHLGAKAWDGGHDLSADDVAQAREYLRGRAAANAADDAEINDLDLELGGSAWWRAGWSDRARERRRCL